MKKGHDVKQVVQQINKDVKSKKDYIVTLNALEVTTSNNTYPNLEFTDAPDQYSLTDHSMNQLCGKLEIGTQYLRKCLPVSQELVAHNLNFWIKNTKSKELMVRTIERDSDELPNIARAVCSNRYKRIDNDVVVTHSLNKLMDLGLDIKYVNYDRDTLNVTAVNPKVEGEVSEGDVVQSGVTITNSEIGSGSLMIQPFIYRLVCTNGMVAPRYLNKFYSKHVGKIIIDPSQDNQYITIIDKMQKQIDLVNDNEVWKESFQKLQDSTKQTINSHQIVELAKKQGVTESERAQIFERLNHYVGDTFTTTKYDLANAITNLGNDEEKSDQRARFFQELGGLIVFAHNPMVARV
tara:strand:- start:1293 stop:2342 length:1050 start_codon:yes stop_codon:yes gene_type:complete